MPVPEPVALDVIYEDEDVLVVNKPAGMVVHPTYRNVTGTVLNGLLWRFRDRGDITPGLVSRTGVIPISAEQDTAGPITRNMTDAAAVLSVIQGVDPSDPATASP